LACQRRAADEWLATFVQREDAIPSSDDKYRSLHQDVRTWYQDAQHPRAVHSCPLKGMPNFAYSYALALFRTSRDDVPTASSSSSTDGTETPPSEADRALQAAVSAFPSVAGLILDAIGVVSSTAATEGGATASRGRSVSPSEWSSIRTFVEEYDRTVRYRWVGEVGASAIEQSATLQAVDVISSIYVKQNANFWKEHDVLKFLYDNLVKLREQQAKTGDDPNMNSPLPGPPSPALMRYCNVKVRDYDDRIQELPAEADVVDFDWLEDAMVVEPNRRRLIRREGGRRRGVPDDGGLGWDRPQHWLGGPPTNVVDPDWPLVEVFWRSFLPWNRVEGVPPPPRR
jgi:hypothetical protein